MTPETIKEFQKKLDCWAKGYEGPLTYPFRTPREISLYRAGMRRGLQKALTLLESMMKKAKPHSDLDTIDLEHDLGMKAMTDPFTGGYV